MDKRVAVLNAYCSQLEAGRWKREREGRTKTVADPRRVRRRIKGRKRNYLDILIYVKRD